MGKEYLFQLPLSFLWLVKARLFILQGMPHHLTNMHLTGIEPWPSLQKGLLCSKSPMCTLSQNGYGANPLPSKGTVKDTTPAKCWAHTMNEGRVDHIHVTRLDLHPFKLIPL